MCTEDCTENCRDLLCETLIRTTDGLDAERNSILSPRTNLNQVCPLNLRFAHEELGKPTLQQELRYANLLAQELHTRYAYRLRPELTIHRWYLAA